MIAVRRAGPGDVAALSTSLSRAFFADPVATFLFPDEARRNELLVRFFTLQLRHNYLVRGEVLTTEHRLGASLWLPPGARPPRIRDRIAQLLFAPYLAERLTATRHLTQLLEANHPGSPHYYLGTIGTDPEHQRRGIASALLDPVLERCDERRLPAYLECSLESNVAFYARVGFAVRKEVVTPDGGLRLWLMWREPRPGG